MINVSVKEGKFKGYGFIIDNQTGMPKVDNPLDVPDYDWGTLTKEEKDHVNAGVAEHLRRLN